MHGYFYKSDVLGQEAELKEIRTFANTLVFSVVKLDEVTPEMIRDIGSGDWDKLDPALLDGMAERINLLESMDYIWPKPSGMKKPFAPSPAPMEPILLA